MNKVERAEILDLAAYEGVRDRFRKRIIELKRNRRIAVGDHMTFLFENRDTVMFQIQEMLRTERITSEKGIRHELDTYNELVPDDGHLSATLLIEYEDAAERSRMLEAFANLRDHVSLRVDGQSFPAVFKPLPGEEEDRLPAVNYLVFEPGCGASLGLKRKDSNASLEVTHPDYGATTPLSLGQRTELAEDLGS